MGLLGIEFKKGHTTIIGRCDLKENTLDLNEEGLDIVQSNLKGINEITSMKNTLGLVLKFDGQTLRLTRNAEAVSPDPDPVKKAEKVLHIALTPLEEINVIAGKSAQLAMFESEG